MREICVTIQYGKIEWYENYDNHRLDGPAVEFTNIRPVSLSPARKKIYYIKGQRYHSYYTGHPTLVSSAEVHDDIVYAIFNPYKKGDRALTLKERYEERVKEIKAEEAKKANRRRIKAKVIGWFKSLLGRVFRLGSKQRMLRSESIINIR